MSKQPTRAGKAKPLKETKGKTVAAEKQPANLIEIVPGKFNENDWNLMLDVEDAQEFVWEIIDEVFDSTLKIIYDQYLARQTIPYTIDEARKAILHIIDWNFVAKENNEDLVEKFCEDEEPEACIIDSWAQGYVQYAQYEEQEEQSLDETSHKNDSNSNTKRTNNNINSNNNKDYNLEFLRALEQYSLNESKSTSTQTVLSDEQQSIASSMRVKSKIENTKQIMIANQNKTNPKPELVRRINNNRKINEIRSIENNELSINYINSENKMVLDYKDSKSVDSDAKKIEESIAKAPLACQSLLKSILSKNNGTKEIELDEHGNIESVSKFDFDKLASTKVKPKFIISDGETPQPGRKVYDQSHKANSKSDIKVQQNYNDTAIKSQAMVDDEQDINLEPSSGVVFKMTNATRSGPKKNFVANKQQIILEKNEHLLRPIKDFNANSSFNDDFMRNSIEEIIGNPNIVKLAKFKAVPPINNSTAVN